MNSALITRQVHLQEGASMLKACSESGMSVKAWLRENGISRDKYYYWKRKLKDICLDELCPSFVEIAAVPETPAEIHLPYKNETCAALKIGVVSIDIYESASSDFLKKLMEAACHAE